MAKRILVVDDEEDYLRVLTIRLEHNGFEIDVARDGEEAFEKLKTSQPDLILLDVQMPKMDGLGFASQIKKDPQLKNIPIIFLTAGEFDMADEIETLASAQDFMLKSVDNEQIIERINNLI